MYTCVVQGNDLTVDFHGVRNPYGIQIDPGDCLGNGRFSGSGRTVKKDRHPRDDSGAYLYQCFVAQHQVLKFPLQISRTYLGAPDALRPNSADVAWQGYGSGPDILVQRE